MQSGVVFIVLLVLVALTFVQGSSELKSIVGVVIFLLLCAILLVGLCKDRFDSSEG